MHKLLQVSTLRLIVLGSMSIFVAGFLFIQIAQADGTTVQMCVKQSGTSYVIGQGFEKQSCKNNEQLILLNIQGPQGPIGPQGPEGASVKLYDANDQIIGYLTTTLTDSSPIVFFAKDLKTFLTVQPTLDSFIPWIANQNRNLYFISNDCSGQGYVDKNDSTGNVLQDSYASFYAGQANSSSPIYAPDATISPSEMIVHSVITNTGECSVTTSTILGRPAINIQSALNSFVTPFHIGL